MGFKCRAKILPAYSLGWCTNSIFNKLRLEEFKILKKAFFSTRTFFFASLYTMAMSL